MVPTSKLSSHYLGRLHPPLNNHPSTNGSTYTIIIKPQGVLFTILRHDGPSPMCLLWGDVRHLRGLL